MTLVWQCLEPWYWSIAVWWYSNQGHCLTAMVWWPWLVLLVLRYTVPGSIGDTGSSERQLAAIYSHYTMLGRDQGHGKLASSVFCVLKQYDRRWNTHGTCHGFLCSHRQIYMWAERTNGFTTQPVFTFLGSSNWAQQSHGAGHMSLVLYPAMWSTVSRKHSDYQSPRWVL